MFKWKQLSAQLLIIASFLCLFGSWAPGQETAPTQAAPRSAMSLLEATVLGIVEGLTEYLPVSSTGHLLLAERAMEIGAPEGASARQQRRTEQATDAYTICIQAGAIIAVLGLYFRRVKQMLRGLAGKDAEGRRLLVNVAAGFFPAAVIGLLFNKLIKFYLFGIWPVVVAWFVGGLAILVVSWWRKGQRRPPQSGLPLADLSWNMALVIGFAQCLAMWPGVSRSLVTIVGGMLVGLSLDAAVEFSFLLGLVTLTAATGYDALKHGQLMLQTFDPLALAVGVFFAFLAAVLSVKWMVGYLHRHGLVLFGYYRVGLALVVGALLMSGAL